MDANRLKKGEKINLEKFKEFILKKVEEHIEKLEATTEVLEEKIEDMDESLDQSRYITLGLPPDHTQELPFHTETGRGLDPEAMLKKMREIAGHEAPKFDLHSNNCSKTTTSVLKAGAAHDPLLESILGEEVLGAIGTPQQVIGNAQRASDIIEHNNQNTLLTRIANSDILNRVMGGFISDYQKKDITTGQKAKAIAGIVGIGILKLPAILGRALFNPSETMSDIASAVGTELNMPTRFH